MQVGIDVSLSKSRIISGEPVNILIRVLNRNTLHPGVYISIPNNSPSDDGILQLTLVDESTGIACARRVLKSYPVSQMKVADDVYIPAGAAATITYPLHLQYSTLIPAGNYSLVLSRVQLLVRETAQSSASVVELHSSRLALTVAPYDKEQLAGIYATILQDALEESAKPVKEWTGRDSQLAPVIRLLLWAYGPDAVKPQQTLMFESGAGFRFSPSARVHAWENIAEYAELDDIERWNAIVNDPKSVDRQHFGRWHDPLLVWVLHEVNERGTTEMKRMLENTMQRFPHKPLIENVGTLSIISD
jgi:hypothetical protein